MYSTRTSFPSVHSLSTLSTRLLLLCYCNLKKGTLTPYLAVLATCAAQTLLPYNWLAPMIASVPIQARVPRHCSSTCLACLPVNVGVCRLSLYLYHSGVPTPHRIGLASLPPKKRLLLADTPLSLGNARSSHSRSNRSLSFFVCSCATSFPMASAVKRTFCLAPIWLYRTTVARLH